MGRRQPQPTVPPPAADPDPADLRAEAEDLGRSPSLSEGLEALEESLGDLESGQSLTISRSQPAHARGWLEDYPIVPGTDSLDGLRDYLRGTYGGGTFTLQWKRRLGSGAVRFRRGAVQLTIAGEPLYQGRRYLPGGRLEDPAMVARANPQQPAPPIVVQAQPVPATADGRLQEALLGILERTAYAGGRAGQDVVGLVRALQGTLQQPAAAQGDPLGQIERVVTLLGKIRRSMDGDVAREAPSRSTGGIEEILLAKLIGGDSPQPTIQQGPPGHLWDPEARRWVPRIHVQQPRHGCLDNPAPASAPAPTPAPAPAPAPHEESEEYEPLTVDELLDDLAARTEEDRSEFVTQILERLGVDRALAQHLDLGGSAAAAGPTNGRSAIDLGGTYQHAK